MCGRFYVDTALDGEIRSFLRSLERGRNNVCGEENKIGDRRGHRDVRPSQEVPVLCGNPGGIFKKSMIWGFLSPQGSLLINGRAESALEKKTFRHCVRHRRCVIPARGFYEWNPRKEKSWFFREDGSPLWMAGVYDFQGGSDRFVILTTSANASVAPVHSRMPLILEAAQVEEWICKDRTAEIMLNHRPGMLRRESAYEQLRFC